MKMAIPLFFFFSVFAIVNVYLPIFFRNMGYSSTLIGILISILEIAGITFTFLLCKIPQKSGKYGLWLVFAAVLFIVLPIPMLTSSFGITLVCVILYAIPLKTPVPVTDSFINYLLGDNSDKYGTVRVWGSYGFIFTSLVFQFFIKPEELSQMQSAFLMIIPGVLLLCSLLFIPKLLDPVKVVAPVEEKEVDSELPESKKSIFKQFSPTFWLFLVVLTIGYIGLYGPYKFFSLYVSEHLHSDSYGFLWALSTICELPTLFFSYIFVRKFGCKKLILFCIGMISVRNFVYFLFPSVAGAAFGQMFHCFTFGLLYPATIYFIATEAEGPKQVTAQAIFSVGSAGFASVLATFLGGLVIDHLGYSYLYVIFGCVPLVGLVLYFFLRKKTV